MGYFGVIQAHCFKQSDSILKHVHRVTPKWLWRLQGQSYFLWVIVLTQTATLQSHCFALRWAIFELHVKQFWDKCTEWSQNGFDHFGVKCSPYMFYWHPQVPNLNPFHSTACRFSCHCFCQQSYCRGAGIRRPSAHHPLTQVSLKPLHGSRSNFMDSFLSPITKDFFPLFKIVKFHIFVLVFVHMGLCPSSSFSRISTQLYVNMVTMRGCEVINLSMICQKLKQNVLLWHFC